MTITFVSVLVALLVGGIEALGLSARSSTCRMVLARGRAANGNFGAIGYLIIGVFMASWFVSATVYRLKGYDRYEAADVAE